jgi:hypothetical protein
MVAFTPYIGGLEPKIIVGSIRYPERVRIGQLEQLETLFLNQVLRDGVLASTDAFS